VTVGHGGWVDGRENGQRRRNDFNIAGANIL